jgi:hypothetical protein
MAKKISINRAPVLTLWATIVAERLGHSHQEALSLGRAVAGLNAQSKGQRIGVYEKPTPEEKEKEKKEAKAANLPTVVLLGRSIPVVKTPKGMRAEIKGEQIEPESVERYLHGKFGDDYEDAHSAMEHLAKSYTPRQLEAQGFDLYEKFRPEIPEGKKGWGAKGDLDLDKVRKLAK